MNGLALFAGGGGLELGLSLALGKHYRPIAYVEREATSAAVLAANMERGWLDKAPVWDDITTFTGDVVSPLVDKIDIVTAGFPCQPWSVAGQRKGTDDERWLWPLIFRLVCEIRPRNIFLENVPGLLHGGIEHVLGDLASVGFDAEWTSVRASDVGAPHRRERVFILAYRNDSGIPALRHETEREGSENSENGKDRSQREFGRHGEVDGGGRTLANSTSERSERECVPIRSGQPRQATPDVDRGGAALGNSENIVSQRQQPKGTRTRQPKEATGNGSGELEYTGSERLEGAYDHSESPTGLQPHASQRRNRLADTDSTRSTTRIHRRGIDSEGRQEQARYVGDNGSKMVNADSIGRRTQGDSEQQSTGAGWGGRPFQWPPSPQSTANWREVIEIRPDLAPAIKPEVRGVANGMAGGLARNDRLRILGNGVVPQQAALAYLTLLERLERNHND